MKKLLGALIIFLFISSNVYGDSSAELSNELDAWTKQNLFDASGKKFKYFQCDGFMRDWNRCLQEFDVSNENSVFNSFEFLLGNPDNPFDYERILTLHRYLGMFSNRGKALNRGTAYMSGPGIMNYKDDSIYFGMWMDGKRDGLGTYWNINTNVKYVGVWKEDVWHGEGILAVPEFEFTGKFKNMELVKGTLKTSEGDVYVGELKNNTFHGQGSYTGNDGAKYVGVWNDGQLHGRGTKTSPDGKIDMGIWKNGELVERLGAILIPEDQEDKEILKQSSLSPCKKNDYKKWTDCKGIYLDPEDKNKYTGDWKDGKFDGQGTYVLVDGTKYVGEWKDNKKHGEGNLTLASGDTYVGGFREDLPHGQGTYVWVDGTKYVGEWKDNKKHGEGNLTLASGDTYVGGFTNDKFDGQGTYVWVNGTKYVGEWKDNKKHGEGNLTLASGDTYVGGFTNDKFDGQGTYVWIDGTKYVGEWIDGKSLDMLKAEKKEAERLEKIRKKEEAAKERERLKEQKKREKAEKKRKKEKSKTGSSGLGKYNTSAWGVVQGAGSEFEARDLLLFATECVKSSSYAVQEALSAYLGQASNLFYQKNYNGAIRAFKDLMNLGRSNGARNCNLHLQDRFRN